MKTLSTLLLAAILFFAQCQPATNNKAETAKPLAKPFVWENATIYFLLTDRFNNGNPDNDFSFGRKQDGAPLRNFIGGDLRGVIQKLDEGYFDKLGVDVIWTTPVFEQIKGSVDEGYGQNYGYHGYWMRDWTAIDPNFGTIEDFKELVQKARAKGIKIMMDVVLNHTGPVSDIDSQWPDEWVRTGPKCEFQSYESTVTCTLVENLPDIRTESDEAVELPPFLVENWEAEGRLEQELAELDAFFERTGHPRAPRFYIMKWLTDYIRELGIDAFRVDTVKHVEESVWGELYALCVEALDTWRTENPDQKMDDEPFFMLGEVYNYSIFNGKPYTMDGGEVDIDYYEEGFKSLINFAFRSDVTNTAKEIFAKYDSTLNSDTWSGLTTVNYIASHDDGTVPDKERTNIKDFATKLLLNQGIVQIYYGDETARPLVHPDAEGDADLRTFMNWEELKADPAIQEVLAHWQKIGTFRKNHPAIGAGTHTTITEVPYTFQRSYQKGDYSDEVVVSLTEQAESTSVSVGSVFKDGDQVRDAYSGKVYTVESGKVKVEESTGIILLEVAQ